MPQVLETGARPPVFGGDEAAGAWRPPRVPRAPSRLWGAWGAQIDVLMKSLPAIGNITLLLVLMLFVCVGARARARARARMRGV